ncbi:TonB family protein [Carboxylicivirga sp. RSCT41]|uniref:energy transducer TonB n=1 Tax=Carboxylicivirga agarovorans TaxID=3417570 RepID=UPI003D3599E7
MKASIFSLIILITTIIETPVFSQDEVSDLNVYTTVDKMPRLKGAGKDLSSYLFKQIDYSDAYKLRGIEGEVWVSFVVTSRGEVVQVQIEKGLDEELDQEVIQVVKNTSKWKPGELNKDKVNTQMRVPVQFTLSSSERRMAKQIKALDEQGKRPLFVLDNKLIDGLVQINDYDVESIRIIKGDKAIKLYGDRAKNGVVVITSKRGTPPLY